MTVGELLGRITSSELTEWQAYAMLEPFGEERGDLRAGIVASTFANAYRARGRRPFRPADFMPRFEREIEKPDWEAQLRLVEMLNTAFGGRDERRH